jgi:cellulose synthase (UDP-forming)
VTRSPDLRLDEPSWSAAPRGISVRRRIGAVLLLNVAATVWYFGWLLDPGRIGNPALYGLLVAAELFNLVQAFGFWWTCIHARSRRREPQLDTRPEVDVFIPVYDEPVEIVEATVVAATRIRGGEVRVWLLDDGDSPEMEALAARVGARYLTREEHEGAKAGNINHALRHTDAPYVVVFDCDHVADPAFLEQTLGHFADSSVAFVQTPQYYANHGSGGIPAAAWAQQALFFGPIARGKDALGAMFCCGTNVVFRRDALLSVGGFPTSSITEDFQLSIRLHERGWRSVYVDRVLAQGLGPEDMASYVSQQLRWARGCLSSIPDVLRARLPLRIRAQYLLSTMYFLSGWTLAIYMLLPVVRIVVGAQPLAVASSSQFLVHFAPYYTVALATVALAGAGSYTFAAFALGAASFWVHVVAGVRALLRRPGRFVVTAKEGRGAWQPRAVLPALAVCAGMVIASLYGLAGRPGPGTFNSIAFAALHATVLMTGASGALRLWPQRQAAERGSLDETRSSQMLPPTPNPTGIVESGISSSSSSA